MEVSPEFIDIPIEGSRVRGFVHRSGASNTGGLVLTHGAGSDCQSMLLRLLANAFAASGLTVLRCDLPFRQARPHGPPAKGGAEQDQNGLRAAVTFMRRETAGRIFLGGHSYGGRQTSMLAAGESRLVEALLLLSYPLHPPQRPDELRTLHFSNLYTPAMFVHGAQDEFGSIAEMEAALALIPARTELVPIPRAGHELVTSRNRSVLTQRLAHGFLAFAHGLLTDRS
jgi:predicted alpha/beta-hydrolase family hydrolase